MSVVIKIFMVLLIVKSKRNFSKDIAVRSHMTSHVTSHMTSHPHYNNSVISPITITKKKIFSQDLFFLYTSNLNGAIGLELRLATILKSRSSFSIALF